MRDDYREDLAIDQGICFNCVYVKHMHQWGWYCDHPDFHDPNQIGLTDEKYIYCFETKKKGICKRRSRILPTGQSKIYDFPEVCV